MCRLRKELVNSFALVLLTILGTASSSSPMTFTPRNDTGYPAGMIPECPGVMKNASISSKMLPRLQIIVHKLETAGIVRKALPITSAAKAISQDKSIDLKNRKTVFYAVGYMDSSILPQAQAVGTSYCKLGYNVFISETFQFLSDIYPRSVRLARYIGKKIGQFLVQLSLRGLSPENLELVGLSLGSHVVSYAAKHFYSITGKKPSRITGLDPAGPCFRSLPPEYKLNPSDGDHVDVIHTNIDGFGIAERLGHVDFYVNGGEYQPNDIPFIPCLIICSHIRSVLLWWQALENPKKFIGLKCASVQDARFANCYDSTETNYMGRRTDFRKTGVFYLPTGNEFPYYRGKEGLKKENEVYTSVIRNINDDNGFVV